MRLSNDGNILGLDLENSPVVAELCASVDFERLGLKQITNPHITLLSYELSAEHRAIIKDADNFNDLADIPLPMLQLSRPKELYIAKQADGKVSLVSDCQNQQEIFKFVLTVLRRLDIPMTILDVEREYHVSLANKKGTKHYSVSKPWNCDDLILLSDKP